MLDCFRLIGWKLKMQRGSFDFERLFCGSSCSFSLIKTHLFPKQHVVSVNFMDTLLGPEWRHLSQKVSRVSSLPVTLVCSSWWGQWMSSKFGCSVFLLQAGNPSQQFCSSIFCILQLSDMHFYHEKPNNWEDIFVLVHGKTQCSSWKKTLLNKLTPGSKTEQIPELKKLKWNKMFLLCSLKTKQK